MIIFLVNFVLALSIAVAGWMTLDRARKSVASAASLVVLAKARELHNRQAKGFDVVPEWGRFTERLADPDWTLEEAGRLLEEKEKSS